MDSFFYNDVPVNSTNEKLIDSLKEYAINNLKQVYLIRKPLGTNYVYDYNDIMIVLIPKHKIWLIDYGNVKDRFENFCDDFIDDLSSISDKYGYKENIGRKRQWHENLIFKSEIGGITDYEKTIKDTELIEENARISNLLISLLTGSINDISKTGKEVPNDILDAVKRRIILYDGVQTDFIYKNSSHKVVKIQGLAGTGKTELLLRKLKELYAGTETRGSRIVFTCFNKILAKNLKDRIPRFFDFMRVEEQIKWNENLFVMSSWGSYNRKFSGVYSYICSYYGLNFFAFSYDKSFEDVCHDAFIELGKRGKIESCFDYMLIDESQDFPKSFLQLCEKVTEKQIFVAGDIFQNIFDVSEKETDPEYLLNKCYRTDPKTLIFAHSMGMKLIDDANPESYITWLTDSEWNLCGYEIERDKENYISISRQPISRFEDIDTSGIQSVELRVKPFNTYENEIISIIDELREKYKNITPDDIGIIFLENENDNYKLIDKLTPKVYEKYNWVVNKGYISKTKAQNTLFASNINNVKGLEFPFIICLAKNKFNNNYRIRNAMYMALTRSFISSYFVVCSDNDTKVLDNINKNLEHIQKEGSLKIIEPSEEQKQSKRRSLISQKNIYRSQKEIVEDILEEFHIDMDIRARIHEAVKTILQDQNDVDKIRETVHTVIGLMN